MWYFGLLVDPFKSRSHYVVCSGLKEARTEPRQLKILSRYGVEWACYLFSICVCRIAELLVYTEVFVCAESLNWHLQQFCRRQTARWVSNRTSMIHGGNLLLPGINSGCIWHIHTITPRVRPCYLLDDIAQELNSKLVLACSMLYKNLKDLTFMSLSRGTAFLLMVFALWRIPTNGSPLKNLN